MFLVTLLKYFLGFRNSILYAPTWKSDDDFDPQWGERVENLSKMIKYDGTLVDFGCGTMSLKKYINLEKIKYIGVDKILRDDETIVYDINSSEQLPQTIIDVKIVFMSGILEYAEDIEGLLNKVMKLSPKQLILSYVCRDTESNVYYRKSLKWRNHLFFYQLVQLLIDKYSLVSFKKYNNQFLMSFIIKEKS